jgi:hypothetical protein
VTSERPLANVPYSILAAENFFGYGQQIFCNQTATYNNLSCTNPPEQVSLSWMTQSVAEINTIAMTHTLNFYMKVQWRDWRLSYSEGGVTCFNSTSAAIALHGNATTDTNVLQAQLYAVLLDAWGCDSPTLPSGAANPTATCYPYLPKGVWPSVRVAYADATNSSMLVGVFPAPNFLYAPGGPDGTTSSAADPSTYLYFPSGSNPGSTTKCVKYPCSSAEQFIAFVYDMMANQSDPVLRVVGQSRPPALAKSFKDFWPKTSITCSGIRRTPGYLILTGNRQADLAPPLGSGMYGDYRHPHLPSILNPEAFWTPFMLDSMNQVGDDDQIMDQWLLYPNGTVIHQYHLAIEFKTVLPLTAFPFDQHYMIGTRRTRSQFVDRVKINVARAGFSIPPKSVAWNIGDAKAMICPRKEIGGADASDCRPLCTNTTCPGWQPNMPPMYVPPKGNCVASPTCNSSYPYPGCSSTCGETAALCQDVFVFYYPIERKANYYLQNMLAPISALPPLASTCCLTLAPSVLITIMAATAYWNELDDYADRVGLMATALLSMMALQAYVSGALPETDTVTLIHYTLYTSYAEMGFGLFFIICASFCLKHDVLAAKRDCESAKLWMMRAYYAEAISARRLIRSRDPQRPTEPFTYFPTINLLWTTEATPAVDKAGDVAAPSEPALTEQSVDAGADATRGAMLSDLTYPAVATDGQALDAAPAEHVAAAVAPEKKRVKGAISVVAASVGRHLIGKGGLINIDLDGDGKPEHIHPDSVVYLQREDGTIIPVFIPSHCRLRLFVVEFDSFMRIGHMLIFAAVLAVRYFTIMNMTVTPPSCDNLITFISSTITD